MEMNDIIFQPGDRVRVRSAYTRVDEKSPLLGVRHLIVCKPDTYRLPGEVPIRWQGEIYYVPAQFVEAD